MTTTKQTTQDEEQIRQLADEWREALCARDLDRMMRHYAPDVLFYDAVPPYRHRGAEAYRRTWEIMLPLLPAHLASELRDVAITVSGDLAVLHGMHRLVDADTQADATCGWVRATVCYQRLEGTWRVIHEHVSVPFDPMSGRAEFIRQV